MKFTDEELSRILGEHDAGNLARGGASLWGHYDGSACYPSGCLNQVAYNEPMTSTALYMNRPVSRALV